MKELAEFIEISKYAGERFDLIQAGGGNSSVKLEKGEMIIKASGYLLSDMEENRGYSRVVTEKISNIVQNKAVTDETDKRKRESISASLIQEATLEKSDRPSIETLLHSFLFKYTLHTHPIVANMILMRKDWEHTLLSIFGNDKIALVPYATPGIELALKLYEVLQSFDEIPKIIFLQNHGLIITSMNKNELMTLNEMVIEKMETFLEVDFSRYKLSNQISKLLNSVKNGFSIAYLSEDIHLNDYLINNRELFRQTPFCPDGFVFCGFKALEIIDITDDKPLKNHLSEYFALPKIVLFENRIFIIAANVKKAREIEDVLKFQIMVLEKNINNDINLLEPEELAYLGNWEAEKYRQEL